MTNPADNTPQIDAIEPIATTETKIEERKLTDRNVLFLHYLKLGKGTVEAYEAAGYNGNAHSAYELRSYLKNEIAKMIAGEGFGTREGILLKLKKLQEIPVNQPVLSVKEALEILKLEAKMQPKENKESKPTITPIVININPAVETRNVVEITPIDVKESI